MGSDQAASKLLAEFERDASMQPGDLRESGFIATHHDIHVTFADGSAEGIPGLEEELSPIGKRMAELIPALYASMAT